MTTTTTPEETPVTTDYQVVIPTYQRSEKLFSKSLPLLLDRGVPAERITIFLHEHDSELDTYLDRLMMLDVNSVVTSVRGIGPQREAIRHHFAEGTNIVSMDDDLDAVMSATGPRWPDAYQVSDLDALFREMFARTREEGLYVWGLNPAYNPYFLKPGTFSTGLLLTMFTCYGFINRHDHPVHQQSAKYKDEQELSLRAWWYDGGVVRNRGVTVRAEFYSDGGCQADGRDYEEVDESVEILLREWPGLVSRAAARTVKSGWPEIRLARRARTEGHSVRELDELI